MNLLGKLFFHCRRGFLHYLRKYETSLFAGVGENFSYNGGSFTYERITVGRDVYIGPDACFLSADANIIIGNSVMFGPRVCIVTGDHRFDVIGEYMTSITEKTEHSDKDVVIEDDVWIGIGAIILKGVTIGRGSVVGAGSVVTRSIPPYSIYVGSPSKRLRERFSQQQIIQHEFLLDQHKKSGAYSRSARRSG